MIQFLKTSELFYLIEFSVQMLMVTHVNNFLFQTASVSLTWIIFKVSGQLSNDNLSSNETHSC